MTASEAASPPDKAEKIRQGRRHPLYKSVRILLIVAALYGAMWGFKQFALTLEEMRFSGDRSEEDFFETLAGEFATAAATMDFDGAVTEALDEEDYERATVLFEVAERLGLPMSGAVRERFADETDWWSAGTRALWDGAAGALTGQSDSVAGLAATVASDVFVPVYADTRDIIKEGGKLALGFDGDEVILGLAVVGLAIPVAGPATDSLKAALRYGRRSVALTQDVRRLTMQAVDVAGAKSWLRSGGVFSNPGMARTFVRQDELKPVLRAGSDLGSTAYHGGGAAASMALRYSDNVDELALFSRTAKRFGKDSAGMMAVLGKRLPRLVKTWHVSAPMAAKLLALGSLMSAAGMLLAAAFSSTLFEWMSRRVALNWLAGTLAR